MKVNKCYMFGKEFDCILLDTKEGFSLEFGKNELVDKDGKPFYIYCDDDSLYKRKTIQIWYEDFIKNLYYEDEEKVLIDKSYLSKETILEILREFDRILELSHSLK